MFPTSQSKCASDNTEPIKIQVLPQLCLHILIETHLLSNERARTILNIFEQCMRFILLHSTIDHRKKVMEGYRGLYNNKINARVVIGQSAMVYCAGKPMEKSRVFLIII